MVVPNYQHGMGTIDHLAGFRALIGEGLNGVVWPDVQAQWDVDEVVIAERTVTGSVEALDTVVSKLVAAVAEGCPIAE